MRPGWPQIIMRNALGKYKSAVPFFSFWFLILPAYLYLVPIDGLDIVPHCVCLMNIDEGDSIPSEGGRERVTDFSLFTGYSEFTDAVSCFLGPAANLPNQLATGIESRSLILRC